MKQVSEIQALAWSLSEQEFIASHPLPALVWLLPDRAIADEDESDLDRTISDRLRSLHATQTGTNLAALRRYVTWLEESERNQFHNIITIGRAPVNDICLNLPSVSKIHAFFMCIGPNWMVSHGGATNGLTVNGEAVASDSRITIDNGTRLMFGPDALATFYAPVGLYHYLASLSP